MTTREKITKGKGRGLTKVTLPSGVRYEAVVDAPVGTGERRKQMVRRFPTVTEAQNWVASVKHGKAAGDFVAPTKMTLAEFATSWLENVTMGKEAATRISYECALRLPLERLGNVQLRAITEEDVIALVAYAHSKDRKRGGKEGTGLSPRAIQSMLVMFRRLMRDAMRQKKITANPVQYVRGPQQKRRKVETWGAPEVQRFLATARDDRLGAVYRLSLLALRPEEVAGLHWTDLDLDGATVSIERARTWISGHGDVVKDCKTEAGVRMLPLDAGTVTALRQLRRRQAADRLKAGEAWTESPYLLVDELGVPMTTADLRRAFYRLAKRAGCPKITLYTARHSCLTYLANSGAVPISIVALWAGHSDGGTMALAKYIHPSPADLAKAQEAAGRLLDGSRDVV